MPSSYFYHKDPETANLITWRILVAVFILCGFGFLYFRFFADAKPYYDKVFYEKISAIGVPGSGSIIESFDYGEFRTATFLKWQ